MGITSPSFSFFSFNPSVLSFNFNINRFVCSDVIYSKIRYNSMSPFFIRVINSLYYFLRKLNARVNIFELTRLFSNSKVRTSKMLRKDFKKIFLGFSCTSTTIILPNFSYAKFILSHFYFPSKLSKVSTRTSNAEAIFSMFSNVMFFSALSIIPIYVRCSPALSASSSCERPRAILRERTELPKPIKIFVFIFSKNT